MSEKKSLRPRRKPSRFAAEVLTRPGLKDIPVMPDLAGLAPALDEHKIKLSQDEFDLVRVGVAIYVSSRRPRLSLEGMQAIATALAIGSDHAMRDTGSHAKTDYPYRQAMTAFLRRTGFIFISESERNALGRLLADWDDMLAWFDALPANRRKQLTDPEHLWNVFKAERDLPFEPAADSRAKLYGKRSDAKHARGNLLDALHEMELLRDQAEAETALFRSLVETLRERLAAHGMSEAEIAELLLAARDRHFGHTADETIT